MLALAAIPSDRRTDREQRAADAGVEFLLSHDPAVADYPMGYGNTKPNSSWFKPGFPSAYVQGRYGVAWDAGWPQFRSTNSGGQVAVVFPGFVNRKSHRSQPQARVLVRVRPSPAASAVRWSRSQR